MKHIYTFTKKMSKLSSVLTLVTSFFFFFFISGHCNAALTEGFYQGKCGSEDVEAVVGGVVASFFKKDDTIAGGLLRMQFHDCFVRGCDASILLNGSNSEKTSGPNFSVRGYDLIDAVKEALEAKCPGVVSCADIIIMATRDAVSLSGGGRYAVQTGRRDGTVSNIGDVNLPGPGVPVSVAAQIFAAKGFNVTEMVYLLGAHTVGFTHCSFIQSRLYNFRGSGKPDPTMDEKLLQKLMTQCPKNFRDNNAVALDQNPSSAQIVDDSFYRQILAGRGVLQIDQQLALDQLTTGTVNAIVNRSDFSTKFGEVMVKLGAIDVLTGNQGEIRTTCAKVN